MFDTGAYTTILNSEDVPLSYRLSRELMRMVGMGYKRFTPKLRIGNDEFSGFNYNVQNMGKDGFHMIIGNNLLKRFNLILDNKNGHLYLKANALAKEPYGKRGEYYLVLIAVGALVIVLAGIVVYIKTRKKLNQPSLFGSLGLLNIFPLQSRTFQLSYGHFAAGFGHCFFSDCLGLSPLNERTASLKRIYVIFDVLEPANLRLLPLVRLFQNCLTS